MLLNIIHNIIMQLLLKPFKMLTLYLSFLFYPKYFKMTGYSTLPTEQSSTNVKIQFSCILRTPELIIHEEMGATAIRNACNYLQFDMVQYSIRLCSQHRYEELESCNIYEVSASC
jgi:hypothetical protein